jgi:diadenosine tetraphosphatase ApaH/serine/threonine PP2A family protein phosphatase
MKIAIFADIHSNLEAFTAVKEDINKVGVDKRAFLGDVCGYGPNPAECIEELIQFQKPGDILTLGNHDNAVLTGDVRDFRGYAERVIDWHKSVLQAASAGGTDYIRFLQLLTREGAELNLRFVHGSNRDPVKQYILKCDDALVDFFYSKKAITYQDACGDLDDEILFAAHSHKTGVYFEGVENLIPKHCENKEVWCPVDARPNGNIFLDGSFDSKDIKNKYIDSITIPKGKSAVVVVGSVGQSRDRDPRACWVLYDTDTGVVEFHRVPYDIEKTIMTIKGISDIASHLGERLKLGE